MMQMLKQGIIIFDQKHPFFFDICYQYDSPEKKDISLEDRILILFPNITMFKTGPAFTLHYECYLYEIRTVRAAP